MGLIAMQDGQLETAGAISYWALSGEVSLTGLREALEFEGVGAGLLPTSITSADALGRAAKDACRDSRQLIRPLSRGAWAFIQETVVSGDANEPELDHRQLLTGRVKLVEQADGSKLEQLDIQVSKGVERTEALDQLIDEIRAGAERQKDLLSANDVSYWLVYVAKHLHAVSLRDRGGVYFVPRDVFPTWRLISRVLSEMTAHKVFEIPAVKTEEAVEAILTAVRTQVQAKFEELEGYLAEGVSTRGLNSWERQMLETKDFLARYVALLGQALPDLSTRLDNLTGAIVAARLSIVKEEQAA